MSPSRRTVLSASLTGLTLAAAGAASPAGAAVVPSQANLEGSAWGEFSQVNASTGTLTLDRTRAYDGSQSAKAVFSGGANGYSRGIQNVAWRDGDDVWYGAAFFLPTGFKASMQGQVDLLRWDNFLVDETNTDRSGIIIYRSDHKARIMRQKLGVEEVGLAAPFDIPEGRWFHLEVHQHLSRGAGALSEVYLDGAKIASSTQPNTYGRGVDRIRTGIVAIDANRQKTPLTMWFDHATVGTSQAGPLGAAPVAAPAPAAAAPAPAAAPASPPPAGHEVRKKTKKQGGSRRIEPLGRTIASSSFDRSHGPRRGTDGSRGTRWSSRFADRQWWRTDLGRVRRVSAVQVNWESAFAARYAVDISRNGRVWRTVARPRASRAGVVTTRFHTRKARFVRVRSIKRGTPYGISFWEARILGTAR
jgi:hypothetical protein